MSKDWIDIVGFIAGVTMPLFNIPLIVRIVRRRSSEDISLLWASGVWVCILMMAPAGFRSPDIVWRTFNITNLLFFTIVFIVTVKYHRKKTSHD